jgi:hypothetical protein
VGVVGVGVNQRYKREEEIGKEEEAYGLLVFGGEMGLKKKEERRKEENWQRRRTTRWRGS